MSKKNKTKGNFDIIFEKLAKMDEPKQEVADLVQESSAINKLREMVLEVNEENDLKGWLLFKKCPKH